jgi:hypothetical protein
MLHPSTGFVYTAIRNPFSRYLRPAPISEFRSSTYAVRHCFNSTKVSEYKYTITALHPAFSPGQH